MEKYNKWDIVWVLFPNKISNNKITAKYRPAVIYNDNGNNIVVIKLTAKNKPQFNIPVETTLPHDRQRYIETKEVLSLPKVLIDKTLGVVGRLTNDDIEQYKKVSGRDSLPVYFTGIIRDSYRVNVFDDSFRFMVADKQNKILSVYGKYEKNGMMILSASRNENSPEENKKATIELQKDIRAKNLGYVSTLGGFEEEDKNTGLPVKVTELSFIVPYNPNVISQEDFFEFAVDMCKKYNQDSVLIQVPWYNDGKPTYIDKNGSDTDFQVSPEKHLADPDKDTYYTRIKGTNRAFKFGDNKKKIYFGIHVPGSLADAYHIKYSGEITR